MDLPRPALVKQAQLHLSAEGRGFSYLLADRVSGQILRLSRKAALGYRGFTDAIAAGDLRRKGALSEETARQGFTALAWISKMREGLRFKRKAFNPMQLQLPLFDASVLQPGLEGLSRRVFGLPGLIGLILLVLVSVMTGLRNDWKIMAEFNEVFSLDALLTFALLAPFLKIFHEGGHILAATACGVRLRRAGVNIIGLYPLPYVDCSEADLSARRGERMLIAAAGILTDIVFGLVLFLSWHLAEGEELRLVLGRAFVYLVFSSLLFNANPLMRMDGYFLLSDLLHHRNLGSDAAAALKRSWRRGIGLSAAPPQFRPRYELVLALFGFASFLYRWLILATLVWQLLPRYLGFGLFVGLWGGWLMLAGPALNRLQTPAPETRGGEAGPGAAAGPQMPENAAAPGAGTGPGKGNRRRQILAATGGLALIAGLFVPVAPVTVVELGPDSYGAYAITLRQPGFVAGFSRIDGHQPAGAPLLVLEDQALDARLQVAALRLAETDLTIQMGLSVGAAGLQRGQDQKASAAEQLALLEADRGALVITAPEPGRFTRSAALYEGQYLSAGTMVGRFLPEGQDLRMVGALPENLVQHFDRGVIGATLRLSGAYLDLAPESLHLAEEPRAAAAGAAADGGRHFTLRLSAPLPASEEASGYGQLRLKFTKIPVWRHGADWISEKIAQFRNAEIAEKQQRLESNGG